MSPTDVLAAHREDGRLFSHTHEEFSIVRCACGVECGPQRDAHAEHVLAELRQSGIAVDYPTAHVANLSRIVRAAEEWAELRIQDWNDKSAQDVLDIINEEGEWSQ